MSDLSEKAELEFLAFLDTFVLITGEDGLEDWEPPRETYVAS